MDRIFFTRFARERDKRPEIENALKFHGATAAAIVVPVDQLRFPMTCEVLLKQPRLVSDGVVRFVTGSDKTDIEHAVRDKLTVSEAEAEELLALFSETPGSIETYPQPETFQTFNRLYRAQIENPDSFARTYGVISSEEAALLLSAIGKDGISGRALYELIDSIFDGRSRLFLRDLAEYLYLYSGAKNSGTRFILPQQELINWSDSTLVETDNELSEEALFFEVLIESVLLLGDDLAEIEDLGLIKPETFASLQFDDVYSLRDGFDFSRFVDRYVEIISKCELLMESRLNEEVLKSAEEILELREALVEAIRTGTSSDLTQHRILRAAEGFMAFFGSVLGLSYGLRSLVNSFAVVLRREREFVRWQERRLDRLRRALIWASPRYPQSNVVPYLKRIETVISKRLVSTNY